MKQYYFLFQGWRSDTHSLEILLSKISRSNHLLAFLRICSVGLMAGYDSNLQGGYYMMSRPFNLPENLPPEVLVEQFARKLFELGKADKFLKDIIDYGGNIELKAKYSKNSWSISRMVNQLSRNNLP